MNLVVKKQLAHAFEATVECVTGTGSLLIQWDDTIPGILEHHVAIRAFEDENGLMPLGNQITFRLKGDSMSIGILEIPGARVASTWYHIDITQMINKFTTGDVASIKIEAEADR